jgi:cytochrome c biogenesis protein CcmG, thiol:disulfide interchange protein DsbE
MSRSSSPPPADPGFEVDIRRGRRAIDAPAAPAPEVAPARLAPGGARPARAQQTQQRVLAGVLIAAVVMVAAAFAFSWWSAQPPPGVLARINGEDIRVDQVDREILLNRAMTALLSGKEVAPSRGATVEDLLDRRMKARDAAAAGITVSDADVENFVGRLLDQNGKTEADLDEALKGYGLTRADLYAEQRDIVLINSYIGLKVVAGATTDDERQIKINDWVTQLQQTSKVERFGTPDEPTAPRIGATAPDFKLRDLAGGIHSVSDLHGRPVLLNFWATWCEPCRSELPNIQAAYATAAARGAQPGPGLQVLGVAVESDPDIVTSFQKEYGLGFPLLPDDVGQLGVKSLYRVGPIPTSFFIDRQGIIRAIKVGALEPKDLTDNLKLIE